MPADCYICTAVSAGTARHKVYNLGNTHPATVTALVESLEVKGQRAWVGHVYMCVGGACVLGRKA